MASIISPAYSEKTSASSPESPQEDSKPQTSFSIVVAINRKNNGIGMDGKLPWPHITHDIKWFKELTSYVNDPTSMQMAKIEDIKNLAPQSQVHELYNSLLQVQEQKNDDISEFSLNSSMKRNAVIMGRKTWESIPEKFRPLKNRINVVLSSNTELFKDSGQNVRGASSFQKALKMLEEDYDKIGKLGDVFVIGGSQIYKEALAYNTRLKAIYLTRVGGKFQADCFFPAIDLDSGRAVDGSQVNFTMASISKTYCYQAKNAEDQSFTYDFCILLNQNILGNQIKSSIKANQSLNQAIQNLVPKFIFNYHPPHQQQQYLSMVRDILNKGRKKGDRTGTGTIQLFGRTMRFDLSTGAFPLLTTKDVYWRGVAQELLWFLRGETNAKTLSEKKVRIWDANGSREFLDSIGLTERQEGDLGPVYGFQWRHFGAEYQTMHEDYSGKGVDQIERVLRDIVQNPDSRRIIMSAWNPAAEKKMALPPCHLMAQFNVVNGVLSCQMYQRSADMGLGVPFNIASYSLLTRLIAHVTELKAGDFIHVIGDCHVYSNHVDALKEQLNRNPRAFPMLDIQKPFERKLNSEGKCDIKHMLKYLEELTLANLKIVDYLPMKKIAMKMAV